MKVPVEAPSTKKVAGMPRVTRHVRPKCPERNWAAKHTRRVWLVHMMMAKVSKRIAG